MALHRSLDENKIIAALLHDVCTSDGAVFNYREQLNTLKKVASRSSSEGLGFLTKTLPRLGKAFDKALSNDTPLNAASLRLKSQTSSKLPKLFGELFNRVLNNDGVPLQEPCTNCIKAIRLLCFVFYKYELPYSAEQEQQVVQKFERTEDDLKTVDEYLINLKSLVEQTRPTKRRSNFALNSVDVVREARILLSDLFAYFDPKDIYPRHGPGAVATKQKLWDKYRWSNVSAKITDVYPLDEYFYTSLGHVCDCYDEFSLITTTENSARVILVPKDSRGPRLISCEPVDYQWIQQGLGRAIVELVEHAKLTKFNVFFTDQVPNRIGALYGSSNGRYATLDLNEASDRVSLELVRLLFPPHICVYLEACRSSSTVLPNGKVLKLRKFAPMGSCLCFPIMALTIWAILTAAAPDADTRESIHVYGDDVIVPTAYADRAMEQLESFGLKINRDKSCTKGFFRESCGMDAFKGIDVTPLRLRTVWSSLRSPDTYTSWIAYANSAYRKGLHHTYDLIVAELTRIYGYIPSQDMGLPCPSLMEEQQNMKPLRTRTNSDLQKLEYLVWDIATPKLHRKLNGWTMLLRFFVEKVGRPLELCSERSDFASLCEQTPFSVSTYTQRRSSILVRRWR